MPTWLITLLSRISSSGLITMLTTRRGMLVGGFAFVVLGSMFGSIPFVLIGAFVMLWSTTKSIEDVD
jgi:hypothetical protein